MSTPSLTRRVAVNATALAAGRAASAALGIVSVGVASRYLGVESYGALAAAIGVTSVVNIFTDIGIGTIGTREMAKRPDETDRIAGGMITAILALALPAAAVGATAALTVYGGADDELTRRAILLLLVTIPLAAPFATAVAYFVARQQPVRGMVTTVFGSVVTLALLLAVTSLDWEFTGVVLAYVVAGAAQWALMMAMARGRVRLRPSWDVALVRRLMGWALPLGGAMLIGSLYWRIDIVLLSVLSSDAEVGLYGISYRMVDALVTLPGFVLITLLPEFARLAEQRERFDEIVQKAFSVMQVGAVAVLAPSLVFAPEITEVIGGPDFRDAAPVLRLLMVAVALTYLTAPVAQAFVALNEQRRLLPLAVVLLGANVALNLALIPVWGARGSALAFALTEVVHVAVIFSLYRRFSTPPRPWRALRILAAGCAMAGVAALAKLLPVSGGGGLALTLILGGSVALALYVAVLYALRAMPPEVHANLVLPIWSRLRPAR